MQQSRCARLAHHYNKLKQNYTDFQSAQLETPKNLTHLKKLKTTIEKNYNNIQEIIVYEQVKELFGNQFFGIKEIEDVFTIQDPETKKPIKLINLTKEQQKLAHKTLQNFINQPEIKQFLKRCTLPKDHKEYIKPRDFMLMLRIPTFADNTPITMQALHQHMEPDMEHKNQGKLIFDQDWYKTENFYTTEQLTNKISWSLITKTVIPESANKTFDQQSQRLQEYTQEIGLNPEKTHRRTPVQIVYDHLCMLRKNKQRFGIDPWRYDRTSVKSATGRRVNVGNGDSDVLNVNRWNDDNANADFGVMFAQSYDI